MNEAAPDLTVESDTGVDVSLAVAGPGARAYAFIIDWHIRFVVAFAWYVVSALVVNGSWSLVASARHPARWFALVIAPALAIYFLYHFVLEPAMGGRTPGKRMAGLRIAARDGARPSAGALLTRNIFRLVDCLPAFYCVGLVATVLTREHVRIGDMAAGTLLVYERTDAPLPLPLPLPRAGSTGRLDPAAAEVIGEILERWQTLEPQARVSLAQAALARYGSAGSGGGSEQTLRKALEELLRGGAGDRDA
jgi:uncharacterized RDD family membrane protein YckC